MFSNITRISGLSGSGFDTEGTIEKLMQAERAKYDKMFQKRQTLTWKKEAYRELYTSTTKLRDNVFNLKLQSSFVAKKASSRDEDYVTVSASSSAVDGTSQIRIDSLAEGISKESTGTITVTGGNVSNLKAQFFKAGTPEADAFNMLVDTDNALVFTINGHEFKYTKAEVSNKSIYDIAYDINMANVGVKVSYDASIDYFFLSTNGTGTESTLQLEDQSYLGGKGFLRDMIKLGNDFDGLTSAQKTSLASSGKISLEGKTIANNLSEQLGIAANLTGSLKISLDGGVSYENISFNSSNNNLSNLISSINNNANLKNHVKATYDKNTDRFVLVSLDGSKITVASDGVSGIDTKLKLQETYLYHGKDAKVYINNIADPIYKSSNSFSINGVTYNLKDVTGGAYVKVDVSTDVDAVFDKIKSFIDTYNSTIDAVYNEMTEKVYKDYQPLTDQQKEAMNEDDIKKWEEKAKSGLLHNDSILQTLYTTMRSNLYLNVNGVPLESQLTNIGIVTGGYTEHGKLQFSDFTGDKLKDAIRNDPDSVIRLFTQADTTSFTKTSSTTITTGTGNSSQPLSQQFSGLSGKVKFSIQGQNFEFDTASDTLDEAIGLINSTLAGRVSVSYTGDKITMTSLNSQPLDLTNITGKFLSDQLKLDMTTNQSNEGIARRLYNTVKQSLDNIVKAAGYSSNIDDQSYLGKQITDLGKRMDTEEDRLIDKENAYWTKFTAMEKYLSQMMNQSSWLAQQLGGSQ